MSWHDLWVREVDGEKVRTALYGKGLRYQVRWRDPDGGQHKKGFDSKQVAIAYDARLRLDPQQRQAAEARTLTIDQLMATWLGTKAVKPKTVDAYEHQRAEILATFGGRLAATVRPSEIRTWIARDRGRSLVRASLVSLKAAYRIGVADGSLTRSPAEGIKPPRATKNEHHYLTWFELRALAEAAGDWAPMVWLMGTTGMRVGEVAGLQVGDVGVRRIRVARAVSTSSRGRTIGTPKAGEGRDVPVLPFVHAMLPLEGRRPGEWLFPGQQGGELPVPSWRRHVFQPAAAKLGLGRVTTTKKTDGRISRTYVGMHPHELRHTAASLAIQSGASVKVIQRMLGHKSAAMTLDLYGHLFDDDLDAVADQMQAAWGRIEGASDATRALLGRPESPAVSRSVLLAAVPE